MTSKQQDMPHPTIDTLRDDPSRRRFMNIRKPRIIIIGGSYAGMSAALTLAALKDGRSIPFASYGDYCHLRDAPPVQDFNITIIDRRDGFFHNVGAPLAHVAPTKSHLMWKRYHAFAELNRSDIEIIQGIVTSLNPKSRSITYENSEGISQPLDYDYVITSTGLRRPWPLVPRSSKLSSYKEDAWAFTQRIVQAQNVGVVVVGGGAVGVEFAGKIRVHHPETPVTLVHSRGQLLSNEPLPEEFKLKALQLLQQQGVNVILNQRATSEELPDGTCYIKFDDGNRLHASMVIMAMASSTPASEFLPSLALSKTGAINVDSNLRVIIGQAPIPRVFAAGDIANLPGIKHGGTAMVMGSVAGANVFSSLAAQANPTWPLAMEPYIQTKTKMALSVGDSAICYSCGDDGIRFGKELVKPLFGSDLGWSKVLAALGLNNYNDAC